MAKQIRLDKYLSDMGVGTRSEVKIAIKKGFVKVNNETIKTPDLKISLSDLVFYHDMPLSYAQFEYYMLNKPAGVVSATEDKKDTTVVELITSKRRKDLFPVGRLDKDTEGLLLLTNDGALAHELLSPNKRVGKVYFARVEGRVTNHEVELFRQGLKVDEEFQALPATLTILSSGEQSETRLMIMEGKFHQVKRMFEAVGMKVTYLKRLSMGSLKLDETLLPGEYRELTEEELRLLKEEHKKK